MSLVRLRIPLRHSSRTQATLRSSRDCQLMISLSELRRSRILSLSMFAIRAKLHSAPSTAHAQSVFLRCFTASMNSTETRRLWFSAQAATARQSLQVFCAHTDSPMFPISLAATPRGRPATFRPHFPQLMLKPPPAIVRNASSREPPW